MIHYAKPTFPPLDECIEYFKRIYSNGQYTNNGPFVQQLEMMLGKYLETDRDIIMVNNATSGLLLAMKALSLEGKEILVPSFTFPATVGITKWAGVKHRYIDINIDTYCIDESLIEDELSNNDNIEAIIAVNCFGNACNTNEIEKIAREYNVKVIYDSAPSLGSEIGNKKIGNKKIGNKKIGNFGDIEVFSLHATKILPIGEGGFLSVADKEIARKSREMKNFGFGNQKNIISDGLNFKLSEFHAVFGITGLKYLDTYVSNRRKYVEIYKDRLKDVEHIKFQRTDHCKSSYQGLTVRVDSLHRDKLFDYLMSNGVECKKYFDVPLHKMPIYRSEKSEQKLLNTELLSSQVLSLPLYSVMDETSIYYITDKIKEYFYESRR